MATSHLGSNAVFLVGDETFILTPPGTGFALVGAANVERKRLMDRAGLTARVNGFAASATVDAIEYSDQAKTLATKTKATLMVVSEGSFYALPVVIPGDDLSNPTDSRILYATSFAQGEGFGFLSGDDVVTVAQSGNGTLAVGNAAGDTVLMAVTAVTGANITAALAAGTPKAINSAGIYEFGAAAAANADITFAGIGRSDSVTGHLVSAARKVVA